MLRRVLAASRYAVLIAVFGTLVASLALLVYEATVVVVAVVDAVRNYSPSSAGAKTFAVGLIEAVDVFLIAIAVYIISLGLYVLFVDEGLPLPGWLEIRDLDDLKNNLVSVVIAVLAVLFLREAMAWNGGYGLVAFGAAVALIIATLTFFLINKGKRND
jgi:uncharacterized membrane protein YqhA